MTKFVKKYAVIMKIYTEYFRRYDEFYVYPYLYFNSLSRRSGLYEIGIGWLQWGISIWIQL